MIFFSMAITLLYSLSVYFFRHMTKNMGPIMQEEVKKLIDLKGRWWQEQ
jgi:uncharacterized PurR-regulated membrane protein YhhQ (DUF165 family)